ncbi:MAG TPA: SUF system NifU family Fe-S cluster assembly protein [Fimbriimonas sp.]|nr:SUF system NifU family Fe-S cluster assembly protein [Fimbriimonas sp.]
MSFDLRELYQEVILDHNRRPRNKGRLEEPTGHAEGYNPLCGDMVSLTLLTENGRVKDIAFDGQGCAISTASASLMTEAVKGKTVEEAETLFREFQDMVTETGQATDHDLGELEVFAGVREYPVRIKCAILPWHALHAALNGETSKVSTE